MNVCPGPSGHFHFFFLTQHCFVFFFFLFVCLFGSRGEHSDGHHQTESFDYIVASDVVFNEALFKPLIHTIVALSGFNTTLLLAHSARHKSEGQFFTFYLLLSSSFVFFFCCCCCFCYLHSYHIIIDDDQPSSLSLSLSLFFFKNFSLFLAAAFFKELSKYYIVTKLHRINVKVKKAKHPNDKLGTSKDIVLFHMKRRRYSIVSLS